MARYIDADELLKEFEVDTSKKVMDISDLLFGVVRGMIERQPTADVVEVVRCKDCKHWRTEHGGFCEASNALSEINNENNDFCSYGERK